MKKLYILLFILAVSAACVPTQKYRDVSDKSNKLELDRDQLMMDNEQLTVENTEMKAKMDYVEAEQERFIEDSIQQVKEINELSTEVDKLTRQYNDLKSTHEALLQGNARETRRLLNQLQTTQEDLQKKEDRLTELEGNVNQGRQDITRMRAELEARNAKLAELERILDSKDAAARALKEAVSNALTGFEGQGLTVEIRNGKVYVSMDEKATFSLGKL